MKHIAILVPQEAVLASIFDPQYIFAAVNDFLVQEGREPLFRTQLVGIEPEVKLNRGAFTVHADVLMRSLRRTDLIIVPAILGDIDEALEKNRAFFPWIARQYRAGAEVASLCIGAFLLASTGLLDGHSCSTHWIYANEFRRRFPRVNLVDDRIITEEEGLYSSGGASSYWNLLLYLVEKYAGRDMAIRASKYFAIEIDRKSQSPFIMFNGQKRHDDTPVKEAQAFIEENVAERISVEDLAVRFAMGKRHFERRFKRATHNTPLEYIQRVKMETAKRLLEGGRMNVNEVMYEVGYLDNKAFRTVFKKITGLTPVEYKNRYAHALEAR